MIIRKEVCKIMKTPHKKGGRATGRNQLSLRFNTVVVSSFCFLLAFLGILYHQFQLVLLDTLNARNTEFVTQVSATSAFAEEFLQNMANQIFYTHSVTKLRSYREPTNNQVIEGIRELNSFSASSTIIDSIYIFNGKQGYIYSTSSTGAISNSLDAFADQAAVELFQNRTAAQRLVPIRRWSMSANQSSNRDLFSFLFYELDGDGRPRDNAIMFNISRGWFSKLYFGNQDGAEAFIIDPHGELVAIRDGVSPKRYQALLPQVLSTIRGGTDSGYFISAGPDGEKSICFFSPMQGHLWYYIKCVPYADSLRGLREMEHNALVVLATGFGVLFVAGAAISFHIYLPFRRIASRLSLLEPTAPQDTGHLMESLNRLIESSSGAERIRSSLEEMLRGEALQGLLLGTQDGSGPEEALRECHLSLAPRQPLLLCLVSGLRLPQYLEVIRPGIPRSEGVVIQNEYTVLFLQPSGGASLSPALQQLCAQFPASWFILSPEISGWQGLPAAYERLLEAFRLRFLSPREKLLYSEAFQHLDDSPSALEERVDPILQALRRGSYARTWSAYQEFTACFPGKSYQSIVFSLTSLSNGVYRLFNELFPEEGCYEELCQRSQNSLRELEDIEALDRSFQQLFQRIAGQIQQDRQARQEDVLTDILGEISRSYCDPNLSSQSLADQFGLSSAYLCRMFRQANGCSLVEHINRLRIDKAQEALLEPGVKVKDVPQQVGMENRQYFFRLFKQATGFTPRQYQARFRDGGEKEQE